MVAFWINFRIADKTGAIPIKSDPEARSLGREFVARCAEQLSHSKGTAVAEARRSL
jgi:hypothetical protein